MKFAVIPASGIGDGLIMLIASHHLRKLGHDVTTFHSHLPGFGRWLEKGSYLPVPTNIEDELSNYDAVLLQHDNSDFAKQIVFQRKTGRRIFVFYPSYRHSKHGPLFPEFDFAFDEEKNMVFNCCQGTHVFFGGNVNATNGFYPLPHLIHRKHQKKVLIHPTSGNPFRNWPKHRFFLLAKHLNQLGFHIEWLIPFSERSLWPELNPPHLPSLEDLASLIYESDYFIGNNSGPGHLASYLSIPHLIIGHNEQHMRLWKPGWHLGEVICPPQWIPNWKGFRIRERHWKEFISVINVLSRFISITKQTS